MPIQKLDPMLANQIAAGEVVERPAAVVKELFENAVDAGATDILIEIGEGGHRLIRVTDNGSGIPAEELPLAVARHATSKITVLSDLMAVNTLGFRGEALASIASVSRFSLTSRTQETEAGAKITFKANTLDGQVVPVAHPVGTCVDIADLFYNVPARRAFLRTPRTEFTQILSVVNALALSHQDIRVRLIHNEKTTCDYPAALDRSGQEDRLAAVLGADFLASAVTIDVSASGYRLWGWPALPIYSRARADQQYCYLNGRLVRDKVIAYAVRSGYEDILYQGRQPAYVLYLSCDPALVDVNVHPNKQSVRFQDARMMHDFLRHAIKSELAQAKRHTAGSSVSGMEAEQGFRAGNQAALDQAARADAGEENTRGRRTHWRQRIDQAIASAGPAPDQVSAVSVVAEPSISALQGVAQAAPTGVAESTLSAGFDAQAIPVVDRVAEAVSEAQAQALPFEEATMGQSELLAAPSLHLGEAVAQLHGVYILAQSERGLVIVDMHAAHERILYEEMKAARAQGALPSQQCLVPIEVAITEAQALLWEAHAPQWSELGLCTELIEGRTIAVSAVPAVLRTSPVDQLVRDLLSDLGDMPHSDRLAHTVDACLGNMACAGAIKANHQMTLAEMNGILRAMEKTPNSGFCNHGRPTWLEWTCSQLDQFFLRGQ
jgi:DNA mismatch repair protein MutL